MLALLESARTDIVIAGLDPAIHAVCPNNSYRPRQHTRMIKECFHSLPALA